LIGILSLTTPNTDKESQRPAFHLSGLARFVLPSVADLIFISLFLSLLVGGLSARLLGDADAGWHIRNGEQVLDTRSIPRTDSFSSTMSGRPWFAWEWLFDVLVGGLHMKFALNGVVWFCALVIAITFSAVFRSMMSRGTDLITGLLLILLAVSASTIHLFARPHIASWLFVWLWFVILDRGESDATSSRALYWLPILMVFWVNLHGGFLLGIVILACFWGGALLESFRLPEGLAKIAVRQRARILGIVGLLTLVASLVNPYGFRLHEHIFGYLTNRFLMYHVDEFLSPDFHGTAQKCFAALVALAILTLARSPEKLRASHLIVLLVAVYAGLYASRNLPVASILLVLIIGPKLSTVFKELWRKRIGAGSFLTRASELQEELRGHMWPGFAIVVMLAICAAGGRVGARAVLGAHFDSARFPVQAADAVAKSESHEPILCPDTWGGYLIFRLSPKAKVVVDDRHDFYGQAFLQKYLRVVRIEPGWNQVLDEWNVRRILMPSGSALANMLREAPDWHVTHEDSTAVLFERPSTSHASP
jgi:hypothetical protein